MTEQIHSSGSGVQVSALIPLRGGSKRIPRKNIKLIAGKPLAYWACLAAARSKHIARTYVSTDCLEIASVVENFGLDVHTLHRDASLAGDQASTESVMLDAMHRIEPFDILATIQATSPLTSENHLDAAIELMLEQGFDSLLTGTPFKRFVWSMDGTPLNYDYRSRPFSQEFAGSVVENGAFYLTRRAVLEQQSCRLGGSVGVYAMPEWTFTELDQPEDWPIAEKLVRKHRTCLRERISRVKVVFSDFDGVWTDNTVSLDDQGHESVRFTKEDSLGLNIFRERHAIPVIVVSKEQNPVVRVRCKKLGLPVFEAVDDKTAAIERQLADMGLSWQEVCYIGNDVNDLGCLERAALSVCPSDAALDVRAAVDLVLARPGGHGAMRELFELFGK